MKLSKHLRTTISSFNIILDCKVADVANAGKPYPIKHEDIIDAQVCSLNNSGSDERIGQYHIPMHKIMADKFQLSCVLFDEMLPGTRYGLGMQ